MKSDLKRFKELIKYPLNEEMQKSIDFDKNNIETNGMSKTVFLKIAENPYDDQQHSLYLFLLFDRKANPKLPELIYYFRALNKSGDKYTTNTMYSRNESKKFIPKNMLSVGIITDKINLMFEKLIKMDKPIEFTMITYEKLDNNSLKRFEKLVETIKNNSYFLIETVINKEGKNYWNFSQYERQLPLTEEQINKLGIRTQEEWNELGDRSGLIEYLAEKKKKQD